MGWNLFKSKGKKAAPKRGGGDGIVRRATGVETGLPPGAWLALKAGALTLAAVAACWGGRELFNRYYFSPQGRFALTDVRRNVEVSAGKLLNPDTIYQILSLKDGMNQFQLPIGETRQTLLVREPNIKDLKIVRQLPDKMSISIIERSPVARVQTEDGGWVVDDEGIPFVRYVGTEHLPLIKKVDLPAQMQAGRRVHGMAMAAVQMVNNMRRVNVKLKLLELEAVKDDYLLLTMSDHRQVKFAWDGMTAEKIEAGQTQKMQKHYDELELLMESPVGLVCLMWDARVPGRITGMPPSLN